jgi:hypothetical protein
MRAVPLPLSLLQPQPQLLLVPSPVDSIGRSSVLSSELRVAARSRGDSS